MWLLQGLCAKYIYIYQERKKKWDSIISWFCKYVCGPPALCHLDLHLRGVEERGVDRSGTTSVCSNLCRLGR